MSTPFEDLEYLADYLPDEGEAFVVSRRDGELVCEPFRQDMGREGIVEPEFYGRLVQASERLNALNTLPIWVCFLSWFWACVAVHTISGSGWSWWFLDVGLGVMVAAGSVCWIRARQRKLFEAEIRPMIEREICRRELPKYSVIGSVRQHPEMRCLMDELSHWTGDGI